MNYRKLKMNDNCVHMFSDWLLVEMNKRNWIQADLARATGLTTASISKYMAGRIPEEDAIKKIARGLDLKPEIVFRAAGILPPVTQVDEQTEQIIYEAQGLSEQDKAEVLAFIQMKKNLRKKKK